MHTVAREQLSPKTAEIRAIPSEMPLQLAVPPSQISSRDERGESPGMAAESEKLLASNLGLQVRKTAARSGAGKGGKST